ncbi:MAG: hypothetical protein H6Q92_1732, partial [Nitrospirae bacterium]|nr:hypothetical protein [Nitrospirota bacterium]
MYNDAALLDCPIVGIFPVEMRGDPTVKVHGDGNHAREMKGHAPAKRGFMKGLLRKAAEILDKKPVPPGRDDSAANLIAGKRPPLKCHNSKP